MPRAIVLAAGFGTRMGALGRSCPKGLFDIGEGVVMDPTLRDLDASPLVDRIIWISNHRFAADYREWLERSAIATPWLLLDDGVTEPEDRLGATGDLNLALEQTNCQDALVLGSDNLYSFDVTLALERMEAKGCSVVALLRGEDADALRAANCVELDGEGRLARMEEKPAEPWSEWFAPPIYAYTEAALARVGEYLASGGNPDAPGHFLSWVCEREPVIGWRVEGGRRLDIGSPEKLAEARRILREGRL
jgi:glucose-1-phosphate thymidylyltransferase